MSMVRIGGVAGLLGVLIACAPCGSYVISNTTATNYEGQFYNGTWREKCGPTYGTTGVWDWFADGWSQIWFAPDAPGDRSWQAIDIEIAVALPVSAMVQGTVLSDELAGSAVLNPGISLSFDRAGLTEGTVEILGEPAGDPCEIEDGPTYRLRWDLTFGGENGPTYVLKGTDSVQFSTFTSDACGGF